MARINGPVGFFLLFFCAFSLLSVRAAWMTQEIPIVAGWNAVHVKVNPYEYGCDKVFAGGVVDQVTWWNFDRRDDGTGSVTSDSYSWYAATPEACTFGRVLGDECYLVHATAATTVRIVGTPAMPRKAVRLGKENLLGMNIPSGASQFYCEDYFQYLKGFSCCNAVLTTGASSRQNRPVASASQAFWVVTSGSGTESYTGALETSVDTSEKILSWETSSAARTITIRNVTSGPRIARIAFEPSQDPPSGQGVKAGDIRLLSESVDWSQGYARRVYDAVGFPVTTNLPAGASFTFRIRPDVKRMPQSSGDYLGILAISDAGSELLDDSLPVGGTCLCRVGLKAAGTLAGAKDPAGLWVGSVALTGVNRAQMLTSAKSEWNSESIQDTKQAFEFRLLLHAGNDGTVKLMKQAFVGSGESDDATAAVMTDKATAKAYRKKYPAAKIRRVSSANFPFMEPQAFDGAANFLQDGGELTVSFTQAYDAKDNPFQHAFHPNHDNLAFNNGVPSKKEDGADGTGDYESWNVTRQVKLTFAGEDPTGAASEDWNRTVCGGTYRETITGLNKTPIIVEGAFRLYKSLDTAELTSGGVVR